MPWVLRMHLQAQRQEHTQSMNEIYWIFGIKRAEREAPCTREGLKRAARALPNMCDMTCLRDWETGGRESAVILDQSEEIAGNRISFDQPCLQEFAAGGG